MKVRQSNLDLLPLSWAESLRIFILHASVTVLVYSNTFGVPFVFDDRAVIFNELIQISRFSQISFSWLTRLIEATRSVAALSFAVNFYLGKLNVFGYHLVNIIIHILVSWTFFVFIYTTLTLIDFDRNSSKRIALIASTLFAVHPIQIQAVTYIVQRQTTLAALFYLWALLFFIKGRCTNRKKYFALCFLSGILALGSKQNAAVLPVTIFFYEFYFFQNREKQWLVKNRLLLGAGILVPVMLGFIYAGPNIISWIGKSYSTREFTPFERILTEQRVLLHYLTLLLFPAPSRFCLQYDFPISQGFSPATVIAIVFHIVALVVAVRAAKKRPLLSFFILWFYINQVIESSILGLELVYEHRMYLPSMGLFSIVGVFCHCLLGHLGNFRKAWICVLVLSALGLSTYYRNRVWGNIESIWEDVLKKNPRSTRVHVNLGNAYLEHGKTKEARRKFERALQLDYNNVIALNSLGVLFKQEKEWPLAEGYFHRVLELQPEDRVATSNLAEMFVDMERYGEAGKLFQDLVSRYPENYRFRLQLALVFLKAGKFDESSDEFLRVIRLKPDFKQAFAELWEVLRGLQDTAQIRMFLEKAITATRDPIPRRELSAMLRAIRAHPGNNT